MEEYTVETTLTFRFFSDQDPQRLVDIIHAVAIDRTQVIFGMISASGGISRIFDSEGNYITEDGHGA